MGGRNGKKPFTKLHGGCIDQTGQGDRSGDTQKQGVFTLIQFCPKVIAGSECAAGHGGCQSLHQRGIMSPDFFNLIHT